MERRPIVGVNGPQWSAYSHEPRVGKRTRFLLAHGGVYRPVVWVDVRPDSSVVVGTGMLATTMERGAWRRASNQPLPAKVVAALGKSPVAPGTHFSFHRSGVINAGGARTYRAPLSTQAPQQLCGVDFAHPSLFPAVAVKRRDVVLPYVPRDDASIRGRLTVVPDPLVVFFDDAPVQIAILLPCRWPDDTVRLYLQVSLLEREIPWRQDTTFVHVSQDAAVHGFHEQP